jgi:hypothetical protein
MSTKAMFIGEGTGSFMHKRTSETPQKFKPFD